MKRLLLTLARWAGFACPVVVVPRGTGRVDVVDVPEGVGVVVSCDSRLSPEGRDRVRAVVADFMWGDVGVLFVEPGVSITFVNRAGVRVVQPPPKAAPDAPADVTDGRTAPTTAAPAPVGVGGG